MPKFLISLLLLWPPSATAQPAGIRLTPESRVAPLSFGAVQERFVAILPTATGFTAFSNSDTSLIATPLSPNGTPQLSGRKTLAAPGNVVVSAGRPLVISNADGWMYAARFTETGDLGVPVRITPSRGASGRVTCDDKGCFVYLGFDSFILTDTEGRPITPISQLPDFYSGFYALNTILADPTGFTILRLAGVKGGQLVRVDRTGKVVYKQTSLFFPLPGTSEIVWNGEHVVYITNGTINSQPYIVAYDVSESGTFGSPRPLVPLPTAFPPSTWELESRGDGRFVLVSNGVLWDIDRGVTTATSMGRILVPPSYALSRIVATPTSIIAELLLGVALATMGVTPASSPALLSYGPMPQEPQDVVPTDTGYLVMWGERDATTQLTRSRAAHVTRDGVTRNVFDVANWPITGVATLGSDALAAWYDGSSKAARAAIIHDDGALDLVDLGGAFTPRFVVATATDWIVFTNIDPDGTGVRAIRVSRGGVVYPPVVVEEHPGSFYAAEFDGSDILLLTSSETILLSADLQVKRRSAATIAEPTPIAFSVDSHLTFSSGMAKRLDRNGHVLSQEVLKPLQYVSSARVAPTSSGWFVQSGTKILQLLRANPPLLTSDFDVENLSIIARHGDDRYGLLTTHTAESGGLTASAVFFREMQLTEARRRRAVSR